MTISVRKQKGQLVATVKGLSAAEYVYLEDVDPAIFGEDAVVYLDGYETARISVKYYRRKNIDKQKIVLKSTIDTVLSEAYLPEFTSAGFLPV